MLETNSASSRYGDYLVRHRYRFANVQLDRWTGSWRETWTRLGLQPTPFVQFQESIYRYRFQGTVFTETNNGAGADRHRYFVSLWRPRWVWGRARRRVQRARFHRHPGQAAPDRFRCAVPRGRLLAPDLRWRVSPLTVFHDRDRYLAGAPRTRTIVSTTYEQSRFSAGADYLSQLDRAQPLALGQERRGWSAWVTPFLGQQGRGLEGVFRFDSLGRRDVVGVS